MKYKIGLTDKNPRRSSNNSIVAKSREYRNIKKFNPFSGLFINKGANKQRNESTLGSKTKGAKFRKFLGRFFSILFGLVFILVIFGAIVIGIWLKDIENKLPEPGKLLNRSSDQSTVIYDRNGKELYKIYASKNGQNREYVKLSDLHDYTKYAFLAAEDVNFYEHKGVDWKGFVVCGVASIESYATQGDSGSGCGASTISQQLVRNTLMYDAFGDQAYDRSTFLNTVQRKVREMLLTMQVEQTMTKDQILEMYINEVAFGGVNYGIQAGSKSIFNKDAKDLTIAESAILAGVLPSPSSYNPINGSHPEMAEERKTYVLDMMIKHKDITGISQEQIDEARSQELKYKQGNIDIPAPHFVFYVKDQLIEKYGLDKVERGGLKVTTSLDSETQAIAEEELRNGVLNYGNAFSVYNGAMLVLDPRTGQILSMVGSVDYNNSDDRRIDGNVNVTTALRQMGSSMKPFNYITAFERGYGPWLSVPDALEFQFNYPAGNWDSLGEGFMTIREALVKSRNLPALYTVQLVGVDAFIQTAEKMGMTTLTNRDQYGLSITLGANEVKLTEEAGAYMVFANEGMKKPIVSILKVEDNKGNILEQYTENPGERVFDEKDVYMMNWILCDLGNFQDQLMNWSYADPNTGGRFACGKTGTNLRDDGAGNEGPTDLVAFMYNKNLVVAVWTGNNNNSLITAGGFSTTVPLPIASNFMKRILPKYPVEMFSRPAGILSTSVCRDTGGYPSAGDDCPQTPSIYAYGKGPREDKRTRYEVCRDASNSWVIPSNKDLARKYGVLQSRVLLAWLGENPDQTEYMKKFLESITPDKFPVQYITSEPKAGECVLPLGAGDAPVIDILNPLDGSKFEIGSVINITTMPRAKNNQIKSVQLYIDNVPIVDGKLTVAPYSYAYNSFRLGSRTKYSLCRSH